MEGGVSIFDRFFCNHACSSCVADAKYKGVGCLQVLYRVCAQMWSATPPENFPKQEHEREDVKVPEYSDADGSSSAAHLESEAAPTPTAESDTAGVSSILLHSMRSFCALLGVCVSDFL